MIQEITEAEALKINAIHIANHHKKTCEGCECNISLYMLRRLLDLADIELSEKEKESF